MTHQSKVDFSGPAASLCVERRKKKKKKKKSPAPNKYEK